MSTSHTSITRLRLVNFRAFEKAELQLHPELCVLLGNNGSGKTSILDALSIIISKIFPHCEYLPKLTALPYKTQNIRQWNEQVRGRNILRYADTSGVVGWLKMVYQQGNCLSESLLAAGRKLSTGEDLALHSLDFLAKRFNDERLKYEGVPVFAHYGPHRGAIQGDRKRFSRRHVNVTNPFAAYINALQPSLDFDAFLDWFNEEEASELREQRRNRDYVSKELNAVRKALERVFSNTDMKMSNPRFENNPKRFVLTQTLANGESVELLFDQLSDGYRGMIALVADFARRLAIANQYADRNPLDGGGILMIDEVDAHLHPKWQYRVIDDLHRTFPNVQLIVTTHSAEVVSMVDAKNVYILDSVDGILEERHPEQQTKGYYPEDIASMVMNAPNHVAAHPAYQAYLRCRAAIQHGDEETEAYKEAFAQVLEHYQDNHPLVQELKARLEGVKRRRALLAKLAETKL